MNAAKRAAKFLHHGVKRHLERGAPPNQHVIMTRGQRLSWSKPDELAEAPPHPIALHGIADLFADGETNPRRSSLPPRVCLQDEGAGMSARADPGSMGNSPKVTPAF